MGLNFSELSKKVNEINNWLSVVGYDSQTGKGAVLYDSETILDFILCEDKKIIVLGGCTVKYGSWDDLDLDSPLLMKVFNLFEKAIHKIFNLKKIKTYKEWKGDITDYLNINDIVDNEIIEYFRNVLPPKTDNSYMLQGGEAYDHVLDDKANKYKAIYITFNNENGNWIYKGICFIGENTDRSNLEI
ncbi:hypothetical protein H9660_14865 [Clostridium sp. Sa3CUN1]|uniref:DUF2262 domain-containing protein n=1 Tax=Clostridium gallinarum TaxID=2762246 RepID=A0ABR8Q7M8_9CLOT|nr:hypothetical protein [Clostridium gallinarum]MBD7916423.1 hypothetical protein [Clostridium gallinarum]